MKNVICLAVGHTYDIVVDTGITAHPDIAPYPRNDFKYLIPIKKGGSLEYLYKIKQKISCLPNDVYQYENLLSPSDYAALIQYHELRKSTFGYGKADTNYIFYILGDERLIKQPFEKKGIQVSVGIDLKDVPFVVANDDVQ